jgi:hypothetical protein
MFARVLMVVMFAAAAMLTPFDCTTFGAMLQFAPLSDEHPRTSHRCALFD